MIRSRFLVRDGRSHFHNLIRRSRQGEGDRDFHPRNCSRFKSRAAKSRRSGIVQDRAACAGAHAATCHTPIRANGDDDGAASGNLGSPRLIRVLDARLENHRGLATGRGSAGAGRRWSCDGLDRLGGGRSLGRRCRLFLDILRLFFRHGLWRRRRWRLFFGRRCRLRGFVLRFEGQLDDGFRNLGEVLDMFRGLDGRNPHGSAVKRQGAGESCYDLPPGLRPIEKWSRHIPTVPLPEQERPSRPGS